MNNARRVRKGVSAVASTVGGSGADKGLVGRRRVVCSWRGSSNVKIDAWARWNFRTQAWEINEILPDAWCDDCGGETSVKSTSGLDVEPAQ